MSSRQIQYLNRTQLDTARWDACITHAHNGLIYAYSFYLDNMAENWDALVMGDYEAVMPLPWKKKYGIKYIYQPFLTAQLGVFGNVNEAAVQSFIAHIPASFRLVEISLNSSNATEQPLLHLRKNFVLPLHKDYDSLYRHYSENIKRNCRKAWQMECRPDKEFDTEEVIALALAQMKEYGAQPPENVNRFQNLLKVLTPKGMVKTYGIRQNDTLMSSAIFFYSHSRAYYLLVGNHPESKQLGSSAALIDYFIKDNAGSNLVLDFEGSDIPGLASFYAGFGAAQEDYPFLKINRLPFFLKWMKS